MRNKYNWKLISAQYRLAAVEYPEMSMTAFARSRGIPSSTFRKAIKREQSRERQCSNCLRDSNNKLAITHLRTAISLLSNH